jgi:hypothetical protein
MLWRGKGLAAVKRQAPVIEVTVIGTTPPPRSKEGTHPGRVSCVRNTETPTESSLVRDAGGPTARNAESSGGDRMSKKRRPAGESQQETGAGLWLLLQAAGSRITGWIPSPVLGPRKGC